MNPKSAIISWLLLALGFNLWAGGLDSPAFENAAEERTNSGYIKLSWSLPSESAPPGGTQFELQQADNEYFNQAKVIYRGEDLATFLSGLPDGNLYHRVRLINGSDASEWSPTVVVKVKHHSIELALTLFGLGAAVFLCTVGIVVHGVRKAGA